MTREEFKEQLERFQRDSLKDNRFRVNAADCHPCLNDAEASHDFCPIYLGHTFWAMQCLKSSNPASHIDLGGLIYFVGLASTICPISFYDIRKADIIVPNVTSYAADFTRLPFETGSVKSISCLHVLEHIGLGRYGDTLDVTGDLKAAFELHRVVASGGQLLLVLPVGRPKVVFNAHRIYSYEQVMDMFSGFELKEFTLVDPPQYLPHADPARVKHLNEGAGCFWMVKR